MRKGWAIGLSLAVATAGLAACVMTPAELAAQKARDDRELADALGNRVAGKAEDCIDADHIDGPQIIGSDTLIYRRGDKVWRTTVQGCPSLQGDPLIIAEIYGSKLCRNDHFRTVSRGSTIPSGYCFYGPFTPYSRPKP